MTSVSPCRRSAKSRRHRSAMHRCCSIARKSVPNRRPDESFPTSHALPREFEEGRPSTSRAGVAPTRPHLGRSRLRRSPASPFFHRRLRWCATLGTRRGPRRPTTRPRERHRTPRQPRTRRDAAAPPPPRRCPGASAASNERAAREASARRDVRAGAGRFQAANTERPRSKPAAARP